MSDKQQKMGLRELEKGYLQEDSIRSVLCALVLLGYHLIVVYVLSSDDGNLALVHSILEGQLKVNVSLY